jgi:hypothetical protein
LSRREFIKAAGVAGVSLACMGFSDPSKTHGADCLLLEARAFSDHGGWVLDPQFEDVMGSPYLLAHGMGIPVKNAITTAKFPSTGTYHLWVRTRNWCAGDWEAPGRFKIHVAGKALAKVFGTESPAWGWENGGTIAIENADTEIALEDLTGFEGRVDALFFTKKADFTPPVEVEPMMAWRRTLKGIPAVPTRQESFDLVVVGGGMAGCGAAVAAARSGLKVALVHDRPVLGGNASGEIRVHTIGIAGKNKKLIGQLDSKHWPNGSSDSLMDDKKRHDTIDREKNITQFLDWRFYSVQVAEKRITSIDAHHNRTGEAIRLSAPVYLDSTGDAWLGFRAGASFRYGRESKNEFNEGWDKFKELWSPEKEDKWTMGVSVLWNSVQAEEAVPFPAVPWAKPVAKDYASVNGEWYWEFARPDLDQIQDGEEIRDHMFRGIYGSFSNAKKDPKHAKRELAWVGFIAGRRESRRLMGDHLYTLSDIVNKVKFDDAVVEEVREVDLHYQKSLKGYPVDYISEAMFMKVGTYYIPFRSLYSKDIGNLMMAGRNFSCTHVALGGPRVQKTTAQMGIATGYAAVLCKKYGKTPREVGKDHIGELREMVGYPAVWPKEEPKPEAKQEAKGS